MKATIRIVYQYADACEVAYDGTSKKTTQELMDWAEQLTPEGDKVLRMTVTINYR